MGHDHGSEYQIKIVHEDGSEELTYWIMGEEQVSQAMRSLHKPSGRAYWLRQRSVVCPNCPDTSPRIMEYPVAGISQPRSRPVDSRYLEVVAAGHGNY